MVYIPKDNIERRPHLIESLIRDYPFATLVAGQGKEQSISHLPFLLHPQEGPKGTLIGHMARANQQWRCFVGEQGANAEVTVVFHGPHAYISPRFYAPAPDNVPTWNYAVVHVVGRPNIVSDQDAAYAIMQELVKTFDPRWPLALSESDRRGLMAGIVAFTIEIVEIQAKFKLSQNRSQEDQQAVTQALLASPDATEQATGALMRKIQTMR